MTIKEYLKRAIDLNGTTIDELKIIIRELEREQNTPRQGGRPLGVGNNGSQLDSQLSVIRTRLSNKDSRTDIATSLGVSRQTLNEFIRVNLPEFHKPK